MDELICMFTTEATAVYCYVSTFVVVDCDGGTLDLTTRKILGYCAMDLLVENNYDEFQCLMVGNIAPSLLQYVSESGRE
ncbi:hypothetical protein C1646_819985 [Rhizophagus diaphanus]|nr:hypothetical protein C1646_819985 [Rhizophagus diaphanus] [Rhizophagus sp. MUCL 43196]